ncbi:thioesterase II family protein [Streptomyces hygroscopicus]|uniref:thioesterase II family protein n=1 Tax=Streptomyces hygroscopicus TaxID=1912 RepID=UPI00223F158D|nr:alpha/beta fold hydrolase [Streptomyces hygroscopicus]
MSAPALIRPYPHPTPMTAEWKVLFFPHSGGSPASYKQFASCLAGSAQTAAVHYPGRAERYREPCFASVHALAEEVAEAFPAWCGEGPVLLFGHSLGAAIAYETIRRIPDQHRMILVASGHPAPSRQQLPPLDGPQDDPDRPVVELVRELGGEAPEILEHPALRTMFLPIIRADLAAHARYRPAPGSTIRCPVIALQGTADPLTDSEGMHAWAGHTQAAFHLHTFPGGHFFINGHVPRVADILRAAMRNHGALPADVRKNSGLGLESDLDFDCG